jgi:hypothetical protein
MGGCDHRMCRRFGIGLGVEPVEGEAQGAGGIAGTDIHGLQHMRGMQCSGVAGGTGGAGDARLIEQNEHAGGIDLRQADGAGGVQAMRLAAMNAHFRQGGVDKVLETVTQCFDA